MLLPSQGILFSLFTAPLFLLLSSFQEQQGSQAALLPEELRVENLVDPIGIDAEVPRLSWKAVASTKGSVQSAYRVLVASSREHLEQSQGDLWDSGKVDTAKSQYISYKGRPLKSNEDVFWKVQLWDEQGQRGPWSREASWSMGLLTPEAWEGEWIGLDREMGKDKLDTTFTRMAARYLRKEVQVDKELKRATAHIAGLGLFEFHVNGSKIGDAVLAPALAEYPERTWYMSFDITPNLRSGDNALGVILGNGRYVGMRIKEIPIYYDESKLTHYGFPKMKAQIILEFEDGTKQVVSSDQSWKITADGPINANNEFDGEEYDARKELTGWSSPCYADTFWLQAEITAPGPETLSAQMTPPIKVTQEVTPVAISEVKPDTFIVDMGQNMVGWVKMKVEGPRGSRVSLRFAERLQEDGSLYLEPFRTAKVNDIYTLKGEGVEEWEPRFTYHGFRYVEVTGFPEEPRLQHFTGRVVHDALEPTGSFETSNEVINGIYRNARWGIRGNYRSIPTDCPQRDEKQGWLGDRATGSRGESYLFKHAPFYSKWLQDIEDAQNEQGSIPDVAPTYWRIYSDNVTWPAAYIIIADMLRDQFGDEKPIRKHYPSMKKWMSYMRDNYMKDYLISKDTYGDWGVPPESPDMIHSEDAKRKTDPAVLSTSYYFHLLGLMQEFAHLQGKQTDAQEFAQLRQKVGQAFHNNFFDQKKRQYTNNTATTNVLALHFGLVPEEYEREVFQNLVQITEGDFNGHISVGLVGVQAIMRILTDHGRPDLAFRLATNTGYPSWGYMLEQGATTIWELWNSDTADPFMNSHNHVMLLGDLLIWYYEDLAGIQPHPEFSGFKKLLMKPTPVGDLDFVTAGHDSPYGPVRSEWRREAEDFLWKVSLPANTSAEIHLPPYEGQLTIDGKAVDASRIRFLREENNRQVYEVPSGDYEFRLETLAAGRLIRK